MSSDGVLIDGGGTVVSVVYGFGGTVPAGQTFVPMATQGVQPGHRVVAAAQSALAAMQAGLQITSTGTPSITGLYAVDATAQANITAEMIALLNSGGTAFADGSNAVEWIDTSGAAHALTTIQFKAFALAVGAYVSALYRCISGSSSTLPIAQATIA